MDDLISRKAVVDTIRTLYISTPKINNDFAYDMALDKADDAIRKLPSAIDRPVHGYMWICPDCGLPVHSDFGKCPRCGWIREPETVARDIASILENEQDMRVILKNAKDETVIAHCNVKENAELIAQIMDCDVDGEAFLTRCRDCKHWLPHTQLGYDEDNNEFHDYCSKLVPEDEWYAFRRDADEWCSRSRKEGRAMIKEVCLIIIALCTLAIAVTTWWRLK